MTILTFFAVLAVHSVSSSTLLATVEGDDAHTDVLMGNGEPAWLPPVNLTSFHVTSLITSRYVSTSVEATYLNAAERAQEVTFTYEITPNSYISGFSIDVNGVNYPAEIVEKEIALRAYRDAKKRGMSAGYAKESGNPVKFSVGLNVAANSTVVFHFSYANLLLRKNDIYTHRLNIAPGQIVEDLRVEAYLMEPQGITSFKTNWIPRSDDLQSNIETSFVEGDGKTSVSFTPTASEQSNADNEGGIDGDFVIKYALRDMPTEGVLQVNDGYFAHFIATEDLPAAPKKVVFVIDVSGSMYDGKLRLTKIALKAILNQLRSFDLFNIMVFSTNVRSWREAPIEVSENSINEATVFVESLYSAGGTNIHGALTAAAAEFQKNEPYFPAIIFMTDGIPSHGETNSDVIIREVTDAIDGNAALFSVGFGDDVDELVLKRLSAANRGIYRKVIHDESAALEMEGFFQEVSSSILFNVKVVYNEGAVPKETLTENEFVSLFDGREIIIAGKLNREYDGPALSGRFTAVSAGGLIDIPFAQDITEMPPMANVVGDFTERIWAYLTIRELLIKEQVTSNAEYKAVLKERAVALSLRYQLVTPVTALLFYRPLVDMPKPPFEILDGSAAELPEPEELELPVGIYQTSKASVFGDPHFIIDIPRNNLTICFDVHGESGTIVNLVTDPVFDILVNARMADFTMNPTATSNGTSNTLFNRIGVRLGHHLVVIAPHQIFVDFEVSYTWRMPRNITLDKYTIAIKEKGHVTISRGEGIVINIQRLIWRDHGTHFDFFLTQGAGFSDRVHGIVGQFHRKPMKLMDTYRRTKTGLLQGVMLLNEDDEATVYQRKNFSRRGYECWWAKADAYLDGTVEQYRVPTLFDHMSQSFE